MAKAIRLIEDTLQTVDFVIECRDARAPFSTRNPVLAKTLVKKKRLIVLTKKDLADVHLLENWIQKSQAEGNYVLCVDVHQDPVKRMILEKTEIIMADRIERDRKRGIRSRASRALIVGVPNVGKSTLINKVAMRKAARTENRPGVTQALKQVKVNDKLELIDTPGLLWPKFESQEMGIHCALIGSVKETGYPIDVVSDYALRKLSEKHPERLIERYNYHQVDGFFEHLAKRQGFFFHKGELDTDKARQTFLNDIQNGMLGGITWDQ